MGRPLFARHRGAEVWVTLPGLNELHVSPSAAVAAGRKLSRLIETADSPGPKESLPLFADLSTKKTLHVVLERGQAHFRIKEDGVQIALWLSDAQRLANELLD